MKKNMNFEQYGVVALSEHEMGFIRGGEAMKIPGFLKKVSIAGLLYEVFTHWSDVKGGLSDGWKALD